VGTVTEFELFQALRPRYPAQQYALFPQVANATGANRPRHCDAIALSLWPSRGLHLTGFEMKSYRGDWLRELNNPQKAEDIAQFCNYWWIVAANNNIVQDGELPHTWGLLVWSESRKQLIRKTAAKFRPPTKTPDIAFIAAVMRSAQEVVTPDGVIASARHQAFQEGFEKGAQSGIYDKQELDRLRMQVRDFEKYSGVKLAFWSGEDIGSAVNIVLNGIDARLRSDLVRTARRIIQELEPLQRANEHKTQPVETGGKSANI
jgi:hypothetical protein